jgi:uncharacterized membrane protein
MWNSIKKTLVAGLLVLAPITLTFYILYTLLRFLDRLLTGTVIRFILHRLGYGDLVLPVPGLGIIALIALLFITGFLTRNYVGRKFLALGDYIVTHIPLINRIYIAFREISEAIFSEKREVFKKAVIIEYPRKGLYSIGFFTQDTTGPVQEAIQEDLVSVFVPTAPNPTSGYLLFVPKDQAMDIDMSVEDALKLVLSGGSIHLKESRKLEKLPFSKYGRGRKASSKKGPPGKQPSNKRSSRNSSKNDGV